MSDDVRFSSAGPSTNGKCANSIASGTVGERKTPSDMMDKKILIISCSLRMTARVTGLFKGRFRLLSRRNRNTTAWRSFRVMRAPRRERTSPVLIVMGLLGGRVDSSSVWVAIRADGVGIAGNECVYQKGCQKG